MEKKKIQFSLSSSSLSSASKRSTAPAFLDDKKNKEKEKSTEITASISDLSDLQKPLLDPLRKVIPLPRSPNGAAPVKESSPNPCVKYVASGTSPDLSNNGSKYGLLIPNVQPKEDPVKQRRTPLFVKPPKDEDLYSLSNTTMDDYEEMPVSDFGAAILRGMGWDPDVSPQPNSSRSTIRKIRPGFLGLGADSTNVSFVQKKKQK
ncbi:hypothetical protein MDAP_001215 [Mitosporidium daphniae]